MSLFTIRIFKSWLGRNPDRRWSNSYEVESTALTPAGLGDVIDILVAAEKAIHYDAVHFLSATIATWEPDSTAPYNPLKFHTSNLSGVGERGNSLVDQTLDMNVCYQVNFMPELGRAGRRFYRGCLSEVDVQPGGDLRFSLTPDSVLNESGARFQAFRTAIDPVLAVGGVGDGLVMVASYGSDAGVLSREIIDVGVGGVVINKRNHRYFDRT